MVLLLLNSRPDKTVLWFGIHGAGSSEVTVAEERTCPEEAVWPEDMPWPLAGFLADSDTSVDEGGVAALLPLRLRLVQSSQQGIKPTAQPEVPENSFFF